MSRRLSWRPRRVGGSTAPNGSSISSTSGSPASARATPTRCCCPRRQFVRVRWAWCSEAGRRERATRPPCRGSVLPASQKRSARGGDVARHGPMREKSNGLNDIAHAPAQRDRGEGGDVGAVDEDAPGIGLQQPVGEAQQVDLPEPDVPTSAQSVAPRHVQRHRVHGGHRAEGLETLSNRIIAGASARGKVRGRARRYRRSRARAMAESAPSSTRSAAVCPSP